MKNKLLKKISVILLALCLVIPVAAIMVMKSDAADSTLEEEVYEEGYSKSIVDLVKVKKAGDGTDIDGDATNGGLSDLEQMRNYIVEKTDAFYRTQGVKYEYDSTNACYYVTANQSCSAGITKAEGTLTVLSTYNDATNGEAKVTTVAENAFLDCTDVKAAVMPTVTTLETNAFKGCSNLKTAVIKNRFTLSADSFPGSDMAVDICVLGSEEPTLAMQDGSGNTINAGLSGAVYLQNASGACETWKYDDSGVVVKAQHRHTYGEDDVCTNANCKMESVNGVAFEKNYFPARSASSINVEKVASYTDDNGVTETNVAKITTTGSIADVVFDFPEDVTGKLHVRILVESSDATHIIPRTVLSTGGEAKNGTEIAPGTGLPTEKKNVWIDYTLDYSNVSKAYKDRLAIQVTGGTEHVFYVAYAIDSDKLQEKLASDLKTGYLADFSSSLYELTVGQNTFAARQAASVTAETVESKSDKNGVTETNVMKITTTAQSYSPYVADFVIDLPKAVTSKATVRILIESSDATHIGFRNVESGGEQYSGVASDLLSTQQTDNKNIWLNVEVDYSKTDSDYMDRLAMLIQGGAAGGTHTFYIAYVVETDQIKNILAADLSADYLADFDSSLYENIITDGITSNATLETEWLPSYEGEKGVMKVKVTGTSNWVDFGINLPKSHTGTYTLRMYISDATDLAYLGTRNANGSNWGNKADANGSYTKNAWQSITISGNDEGYNGATIVFAGNDNTSAETLEVYLAWIYDGTAEDWTKDTLAAELPADYYVADFDSALYQNLISTGIYTGDTLETEWLSSFEGEEGVMRVKVTGTSNWTDFDITLPKSHSGTYTLRMYVKDTTDLAYVGTRNANGSSWGKLAQANSYFTKNVWQSFVISGDEGFSGAKINIAGNDSTSAETLEVYLAWILDGGSHVTTAEETWRANTTSAVKTTLKSTLGDGYLADFSSADYASLVFGCNDQARDPKSITATYVESYNDVNGVLKVDVVCDNTGDFLVELPKSITQDSIKLRYAVVYGDGTKDANDYLRFKYPEKASCTGMYDTNGAIADLIGDGAWHEIEVDWSSSVKDYLEFQCSTAKSGETVTIYFDEVTEAIP